jgi:hypothetical protein
MSLKPGQNLHLTEMHACKLDLMHAYATQENDTHEKTAHAQHMKAHAVSSSSCILLLI